MQFGESGRMSVAYYCSFPNSHCCLILLSILYFVKGRVFPAWQKKLDRHLDFFFLSEMTIKYFTPNSSHWSVGLLSCIISPEQEKMWVNERPEHIRVSKYLSLWTLNQIDPINSEDNPVIEFMRKYRLNKPMLKKQFPPMMIISMSKFDTVNVMPRPCAVPFTLLSSFIYICAQG